MSDEIKFKYFYGTESEMLTFYRIPKLLVTSSFFRQLTNDAKILYGLMLDRMSLSARNHWLDRENRVFIYFSVEDTMEFLNCGKNKAIKTIAELDGKCGIGLIERKKQGLGKPDIIYVKNFSQPSSENGSEVYKVNLCRSSNETSGGLKSGLLEVYEEDPNKNNGINTDLNESVLTSQDKSKKGIDVTGYSELIKANIEYDFLISRFPYDRDIIEEVFELILETVLSQKVEIEIARDRYPADFVRARFLKLDYGHIEYAMKCMKDNTTKVRNIKKYMLTVLFNSVSTIGSYYKAEANHDMHSSSA